MVNELAPVVKDYHDLVRSDVLELVPSGMESVLDVGGGIGASSAYLKSIGKASKAVVVDLVADNCLPEIDGAYCGNLESADLLDRIRKDHQGFDVILCLDVLEHLSDPWSVVARCHELLNPGGIILASIPNLRNYSVLMPLLFKGKFDLKDKGVLDRTHLRWFVRKTAIQLMTSSGLKLDHVEGRIYGRKLNYINKASFGVFSDLLFVQYFIRVQRPLDDFSH